MKSLTLPQVASILAVAMMASLIPACGPLGSTAQKAAAFQSAPSAGLTVHEGTAAGPFIIPGTIQGGGAINTVKTWTFTSPVGEMVTQIHVTGELMYVPTGQPPTGSSVIYITGTVPCFPVSSSGVPIGQSPLVDLPTAAPWVPFDCAFVPVLNETGAGASYPNMDPVTITLMVHNFPSWSGDLRNLKLQVFTAPFTTVVDSPQIQ